MIEWFRSGGVFMWPILATGLIVLALGIRAALARGAESTPADGRGRADAVLFWGAFAAVVGVLGTLGGIAQMARVLEGARGTGAAGLVWSGIGVALVTTIFGLAVLLVALILWYALRSRAGFAA